MVFLYIFLCTLLSIHTEAAATKNVSLLVNSLQELEILNMSQCLSMPAKYIEILKDIIDKNANTSGVYPGFYNYIAPGLPLSVEAPFIFILKDAHPILADYIITPEYADLDKPFSILKNIEHFFRDMKVHIKDDPETWKIIARNLGNYLRAYQQLTKDANIRDIITEIFNSTEIMGQEGLESIWKAFANSDSPCPTPTAPKTYSTNTKPAPDVIPAEKVPGIHPSHVADLTNMAQGQEVIYNITSHFGITDDKTASIKALVKNNTIHGSVDQKIALTFIRYIVMPLLFEKKEQDQNQYIDQLTNILFAYHKVNKSIDLKNTWETIKIYLTFFKQRLADYDGKKDSLNKKQLVQSITDHPVFDEVQLFIATTTDFDYVELSKSEEIPIYTPAVTGKPKPKITDPILTLPLIQKLASLPSDYPTETVLDAYRTELPTILKRTNGTTTIYIAQPRVLSQALTVQDIKNYEELSEKTKKQKPELQKVHELNKKIAAEIIPNSLPRDNNLGGGSSSCGYHVIKNVFIPLADNAFNTPNILDKYWYDLKYALDLFGKDNDELIGFSNHYGSLRRAALTKEPLGEGEFINVRTIMSLLIEKIAPYNTALANNIRKLNIPMAIMGAPFEIDGIVFIGERVLNKDYVNGVVALSDTAYNDDNYKKEQSFDFLVDILNITSNPLDRETLKGFIVYEKPLDNTLHTSIRQIKGRIKNNTLKSAGIIINNGIDIIAGIHWYGVALIKLSDNTYLMIILDSLNTFANPTSPTTPDRLGPWVLVEYFLS